MESRSHSKSLLSLIEQSLISRYSLVARQELDKLPDNFTVTDPSIRGHPIVYASTGFLKMSGYSKEEVIGKNGRIFQGPKTNRRSVMEIRDAIREEKSVRIILLNYRRDGTPFWMLFHMSPVFAKEDGRVVHFVAIQLPISGTGRSGFSLNDNKGHESVFLSWTCRREVCSSDTLSTLTALDSSMHFDSTEIEEACEASDLEKQRATKAINNVLSALSQYSEVTGLVVTGTRPSLHKSVVLNTSLTIILSRIKQSFVLTNPHLPDKPIVYASDSFLELTGYDRDEVLGRDYRFLHGMDTNSSTLDQINDSIQYERACTVRILNYRKDTSSFWSLLHVSPIRNASGKVAYIVSVHIEEGYEDPDSYGQSPEIRQLTTVASIKVAVRSLSLAFSSTS